MILEAIFLLGLLETISITTMTFIIKIIGDLCAKK